MNAEENGRLNMASVQTLLCDIVGRLQVSESEKDQEGNRRRNKRPPKHSLLSDSYLPSCLLTKSMD
jgi:hypothetical protein